MIIDAKDLVLGRMAAIAAKQALNGEDIHIVNCEQAIITGNKKSIVKHHLARIYRGQPNQGPHIQRRADMFVRRTIRGMLPRKQNRGRVAFSKVKCYIGVPEQYAKAESLKEALPSPAARQSHITIKELCHQLGK